MEHTIDHTMCVRAYVRASVCACARSACVRVRPSIWRVERESAPCDASGQDHRDTYLESADLGLVASSSDALATDESGGVSSSDAAQSGAHSSQAAGRPARIIIWSCAS